MLDLKKLTAEELMLQYQTHSPEEAFAAFNELYARYSQRVFNFLNFKTKNHFDSEDLLQKVFIKIHESKHLYNGNYKFEQWLFVIAKTQVIDYFRANKRYQEKIKKSSDHDMTHDMAESQSRHEHDSLVFLELDSSQNELLAMKFIDELSYNEISKKLNKSEVSLRKSVSRLIQKLKTGEVYE